MNDVQIDYFLAVARNLSFTKTADELYVTQPAVSKQISLLERELGVSLFARTNKGTELTEAGRIFYDFFVDFRKHLEKTVKKAKDAEAKGTSDRLLYIACLEDWNISGFFPQLLRVFREKYPDIQINLQSLGIRGLVQALKAGQADVILTLNVTLNDVEDIEVKKVAEIPRILLYSANHPLSSEKEVGPLDFKDDTFFVMSQREVPYGKKLVKEFCAPYGFIPKVECVNGIDSMRTCVQNGIGVAISDLWSNAKDLSDFRYLILNEKHEVSMAWMQARKSKEIEILAEELDHLLNQNTIIRGER